MCSRAATLITEGSTSALMAEYNLAGGVTVEHPAELFARGSILRGVFADLKSPIAYGYDGKDLPVYFNQDPVLNATAAAAGFGGGGGGGGAAGGPINGGQGQNVTPNAVPIYTSPLDPSDAPAATPAAAAGGGGRGGRAADVAAQRRAPAAGRGAGGGGGFGGFGAAAAGPAARGAAVPGQCQRHAALRHAGRRRELSPTAPWRWMCRWGRATS